MYCDVCKGINTAECPNCGYSLEMVTCPKCEGTGYEEYYAIDIRTGKEEDVSSTAWELMAHTEEDARRRGDNYYRSDREECSKCRGYGTVEHYVPNYQ